MMRTVFPLRWLTPVIMDKNLRSKIGIADIMGGWRGNYDL
jgi:hypothetical protein